MELFDRRVFLFSLDASGVLNGHAVVLTSYDPTCLRFMNSWGECWGDNGFFCVKNSNVLREPAFFDVYWTLDDLFDEEKRAFELWAAENARKMAQQFPSVWDLPFKCPRCQRVSRVSDYSGHILEAKCPVCQARFRPNDEAMLESLYLSSI
jgi:hypothetical protein